MCGQKCKEKNIQTLRTATIINLKQIHLEKGFTILIFYNIEMFITEIGIFLTSTLKNTIILRQNLKFAGK